MHPARVITNWFRLFDDNDMRSLIHLGCIKAMCQLLLNVGQDTVLDAMRALWNILAFGFRDACSRLKISYKDQESVLRAMNSKQLVNMYAMEVVAFGGRPTFFILKIHVQR